MNAQDKSIDDLLALAEGGDRSAIGRLLERYRARLRSSVARRLDRRMAVRVDPSDIVQEAFVDAGRRLAEYLRDRPVRFFPWLHSLTIQRLIDLRRFHLRAEMRSVIREQPQESSAFEQVFQSIPSDDTSPSGDVVRNENHAHLQVALEQLAAADREILNLRYVEKLPFAEIAERLGQGLGAVKMRHLRAVERLRDVFA